MIVRSMFARIQIIKFKSGYDSITQMCLEFLVGKRVFLILFLLVKHNTNRGRLEFSRCVKINKVNTGSFKSNSSSRLYIKESIPKIKIQFKPNIPGYLNICLNLYLSIYDFIGRPIQYIYICILICVLPDGDGLLDH